MNRAADILRGQSHPHLIMEGGIDGLPFVFPGRITVAHDQMSADEINALEQEDSRFSSVGALKR